MTARPTLVVLSKRDTEASLKALAVVMITKATLHVTETHRSQKRSALNGRHPHPCVGNGACNVNQSVTHIKGLYHLQQQRKTPPTTGNKTD